MALVLGYIHIEPELEQASGKARVRFIMRPNKDFCEGYRMTTITAAGKQAEACKRHLRPNDLICVEGKANADGDTIDAERVVFIKSPRRRAAQ